MSFQSAQWAVSAEKKPFWQNHCTQNRKRWSAFVISAKKFSASHFGYGPSWPFFSASSANS